MSCKNCFNGCTEITSDKCVKYTGVDVPALGITNGDTLLSVENALTTFLSNAINGTGIKPILNQSIICSIITEYLPTCTQCNGFTLNEILNAIINATCDIQEQLNDVKSDIQILNSEYNAECLDGVTKNSDTHDVLQAVINKLCEIDSSFATLLLTLPATYVSKAEIDDYIAAYLASTQQFTAYKNRMVPFAVVPYFGSLSNFNGTGAGLGLWDRIFLCNGLNGTPDMRGRVPVGTIVGVGGGNLSAAVNPSNVANPNYSVGQTLGANEITLGVTQIPSHTHTPTVTVNDPEHTHTLFFKEYLTGLAQNPGFDGGNNNYEQNVDKTTSSSKTNITVDVQIGSTGGGLPHPNIQPVIALHYITYIP
jgi:microcystin-dependent protein